MTPIVNHREAEALYEALREKAIALGETASREGVQCSVREHTDRLSGHRAIVLQLENAPKQRRV